MGRSKIKSSNNTINNSFLKNFDQPDLEAKIREEAYLGILANDDTLFNPLVEIPDVAHDHFSEYLVYLMSKPEYFFFMIKILFGMKTFPMQTFILKELFTHRFPILIGARGLSKCEVGGNRVITRNGIRTIKSLVPEDIEFVQQPCNEELYGENTYNEVEYGFYNGEKPTKKIKTRSGRIMECTLNHPLRVVSGGEIVWKNSEDIMVGDFLPVQRKYEEWQPNDLQEDVAYMVGAMVGDGCYSKTIRALGFTNVDQECIDNVNIGFKKWDDCSLKQVNLKSKKKLQYTVLGGKVRKRKFMKDFGCEEYTRKTFKNTPSIIWGASFSSIASYICGLFDTDGCCPTNTPLVELSSKSRKLLEDTQFLLLILGINSNIKDQLNKKYNKYYYKLQISGSSLRVFKEKVGFKINRKQELLEKHCNKIKNDNIDVIPKELILEKLLTVRELARDTAYKTKENKNGAKIFSAHKLKSYDLSYDQFDLILNSLGKSPTASSSGDFRCLKDIHKKHYYYDEVKEITDGHAKTYDVHLKGGDHSFISNGFISHNSFTLGMYILIRMINTPGVKIVITGAGFRQAKLVFDVMETIWNKAPMLRNCFKPKNGNGPTHGTDAWAFRLGDSTCHALPVGHDGSKIRGYRANILIADEMASLNKMIFEEVMSGFLSVSSDNIEQMIENAYITTKLSFGFDIDKSDKDDYIVQNQLILSGTAYYKHNHFYDYYKKWCSFIESDGDFSKIKDLVPEEERKNFNHKDYTVMRIPVKLIQSGHMDMAQVSRIRASISRDVYFREYGAIFSDDSDGFFKRSLINSCSLSKDNLIVKGGEEIKFGPAIYGKTDKKHIFGVDPAYQGDNFAIVILEINETHRSVVHCWTTQASDHKQRLKDGVITENNYYKYCVRKIRDLMKRFPCAYIAMDKGGGGDAITEAFRETQGLYVGEEAIFPIIDTTQKPEDIDFMQGEHILHIIKFSSDWITQANHALKKDMETRDIIFPYHDDISFVEAEFYDQSMGDVGRLYDTLEDCMSEIEDLKNELSTITISETATGKEHFDTPDKKTAGMKKGRLRKDRYSALLMANSVARNTENLVVRQFTTTENIMDGYFSKQKSNTAFLGNGPIADKLNALYCD